MKIKRPVTTNTLSLAAACFAFQGCLFADQKVSGRVVDIETAEPIAGAYVVAHSGRDESCPIELGGCHCFTFTAALTRTDKSGYYSFDKQFRFGLAPTSKFGSLIVYKPGYINAPQPGFNDWKHGAWHFNYQYFYGTGDYEDNFNYYPLTDKANKYYLSTRKVGEIRDFKPKDATPRVVYLSYIADFGFCEYKNGSQTTLLFPMKRAMYEEAESLAKTKEDRKLVDQICRNARGQFNDDKPCHIEDGPAR